MLFNNTSEHIYNFLTVRSTKAVCNLITECWELSLFSLAQSPLHAPLPPPRKMQALKAAMDGLCLAMWIILLALIPSLLPLLFV